MISVPPSCTLCLQAKHSIWRGRERGGEGGGDKQHCDKLTENDLEEGRFHMVPAVRFRGKQGPTPPGRES